MKLQNLTVIFVIIILPVILLMSLYISTGLKTIKYQSAYDMGLVTATNSAIQAFEQNSMNNEYSNNAETKRNILKASVKMFEKSLCNSCGISSYNTKEIEEYIPAVVFGMYDGFYMYAPSKVYNEKKGEYEYAHNLKNYVYYTEVLDDDITIIYSLDNYVVVSGDFGDEKGYQTKSGYLIVEDNWKGYIAADSDAQAYYDESIAFTKWFNDNIGTEADYFNINSGNNPENEDSKFVQHKNNIIRSKIESVLNSTITAYSDRILGHNYKMPKLSEEDWEKIYSNISVLTFFQGKSIGLTKYNGYCVLNSTNSNEYVNPNLMYFVDEADSTYHDIRCNHIKNTDNLKGYKIGSFNKKKVEQKDENGNTKVDDNGNVLYKYEYQHKELACYYCINGQLSSSKSIKEYLEEANEQIKTAYFTSLARERYNTTKLLKIEEQ